MTANSTRTSNKSEGAPKRSSPMKKTKSSKKEKMFGIRFTHPDKVMFPEHHITKANLGQYYLDIERYIKPYFESRPLTLVRCIKGVGDRQFVSGFSKIMMMLMRNTLARRRRALISRHERCVTSNSFTLCGAGSEAHDERHA
eukprot:TRINITY_DN9740_c0_g1_i3.p2 TRINITY_DN9740_c0_g1~~TRINITY_DN9740_c0_g1_i3.p2  ORF type:complete len:142 (+),score=13.44 TRINITY_DN9740_c0_g1_i3:67-492(+)